MKIRKGYSMLGAVMIAAMMTVSGCQTGALNTAKTAAAAESEQFKGGGMRFSYDPAQWRVSAAAGVMDGTIISVFNQDNQALVSLVSYQAEEVRKNELFDMIRKKDAKAGIIDEKTDRETTSGLKRYMLSYWVNDEQSESGKRYIYAELRRYQEKQMIAVLAEYYNEEDLPGIQEVVSTADISDKMDIGDVLGTLHKDLSLGQILDDFVYYENGGYEAWEEKVLSELDIKFYEKDGYEYLYDCEMASYRGNIYKVVGLKDPDYDGLGLFYYDHGIFMRLNIDEFRSSQKTAVDYLKDTVAGDVENFKKNSRDYKNVMEYPMVHEGDMAYQVITVDAIGSDLELTTETTVYYARKLDAGEVLSWTLELGTDAYSVDGETWPIIQELFREYAIAEDAVDFEIPELTLGGMVIDPDQEQYSSDGENEIEAVAGYPLMGRAALSRTGADTEVYVPRGSGTYHWESLISFSLYGIDGATRLSENYFDQSHSECALETITYKYNSHEESPKYYQDLSEIKAVTNVSGDLAAACFSEYGIDSDNSTYLVYQIVLYQDLGNGCFVETELQLDISQASLKTTELLDQYGELIGLDFYELIDNGEDNPLLALRVESL